MSRKLSLSDISDLRAYEEERPAAAPSKTEQPSASAQPPILTRREREVATLVTHGLTNRQIAQELVLSRHTVDKHMKNILKKLGLHSREKVASHLRGQ